jgi:hypothetical protein
MDKITENLSYDEVIKTSSKKKNVPSKEQLANITLWAEEVFQPCRDWANGEIICNSIFRSAEVNKAVGGSSTSEHMANNGSAAGDLEGTTVKNFELFHFIRKSLVFNQLIAEFPINGEPSWIHVSYNKTKNKKQILIAKKNKQGKTEYVPYIGNERLVKI